MRVLEDRESRELLDLIYQVGGDERRFCPGGRECRIREEEKREDSKRRREAKTNASGKKHRG